MPNRSTIDHISALRLTIEKFREFRKDRHLYIAFIDLKAAFDTVDHRSLWGILTSIGAPAKITTLFKQLYHSTESCVRANGSDSEWFSINSGVRQGCVAAPELFNCVIDHLMTRVCEQVPGVMLGSYKLVDLEYADDTTLFSETPDHLREALNIFNQGAKKLGLKTSWAKTELMHIGEGPDPAPFRFDETMVHFVSTFKYLGSTISKTGDLKPEINKRRALAASVLQSLWRPLWRHREISRRTKLRIYNASVVPVLLYGAETWPLNNTMAARLDGFDNRALRLIEGVRWSEHITNTEIRLRTQQTPASQLAAVRRVRWFGHLARLSPDHPTRAILEFDPHQAGWKRPRGAPRTRWLDTVARDLKPWGLSVDEAWIVTQDRASWSQLTKIIGSTR